MVWSVTDEKEKCLKLPLSDARKDVSLLGGAEPELQRPRSALLGVPELSGEISVTAAPMELCLPNCRTLL